VAEVVRHGETGLLAPRETGELTAAVLRLLDDEELRRKMGHAARLEATERFGEERLVADITEVYQRLAQRRDHRPAHVLDRVR
jgi:glycosyltransferase involved in cell wall biosynthesis